VQHRFKCSKCNQIFLVAERSFGQTLHCPTCKVSLRIPASAGSTPNGAQPSSPPALPLPRPEPPAIRQTWFDWLLHGATPPQREIRQQVQQLVGRFKAATLRLLNARQQSEQQIAEALKALRARHVHDSLSGMPVECLKDYTRSVKLQHLEAAGYHTLADLQGVSAHRLQQHYGIGPKSAPQIQRAVSALSDKLYNERIRLPPPDEIGPKYRPLLAAVYQRLRCRAIPNVLLTRLQATSCRFEQGVADARRAGRFFNRLFRRSQTEANLQVAYQQLSDLQQSPETAQLLEDANSALQNLIPPEDVQDLTTDYRDHYADYFSILDQALDAAWGADSSQKQEIDRGRRGGVPEDIAGRVERFELSLEDLNVDLRGYQVFGTKYLLHQQRTVLGDEMGLGKTIQAMAAMNHLRHKEGATHFLVICPASIVGNWVREISDRLTIPVRLLHGAQRDHEAELWRREGGIGVTSYTTLNSLNGMLGGPIHFLVADEAHYVKNPNAQRSQNLAQLAAQAKRVALMTGTALENHPAEFVNLIHMCDRGLADRLRKTSADPVSAVVGARSFERLIAPVYLRRNQEDVLHELPDCIEIDQWVALNSADYARYVDTVGSRQLMAMRQAANGESVSSAKFERLGELLEHYRSERRKVVVFSYFLRALDLVGELVGNHVRIDGSVPANRRMEVIDTFNSQHGSAVMACQITAGGVGINLQSASAVILLEPQLKPTTEWQAIKRVHRMGQSRKVVVHRILARDTVDETLQELLGRKTSLFNEYARESAIKNVSAAATDTSEATLAQRLVEMEVRRRDAALAS
jgi:superfamily II DNA or RNA helicase